MTAKLRFRRVYIEISNICNLKCSFCPEVERQSKVMNPELFRRVLGEVAPFTNEVCLHLMGEPLGHPQFKEIIRSCEDVAVPVNLTTNGMLLHGERSELLLRPIIRQLNISVQSFEANFPNQDPTNYMRRIFQFSRRAIDERPDLYVNYRLWDMRLPTEVSEENSRIKLMIEQEFHTDLESRLIDIRRKKAVRLAGRIYVDFDTRFDWPSLTMPFRSEQGTCHGLINHVGIHADGTVVPCCLDKEAVLSLGNLQTETFSQIVSSERARTMVEGFQRGQLVEDLCQKCTFVSRFDKQARRYANEAAHRGEKSNRGAVQNHHSATSGIQLSI
jgi:radical SAM protein with 4Fe4S-binding SPASM domain